MQYAFAGTVLTLVLATQGCAHADQSTSAAASPSASPVAAPTASAPADVAWCHTIPLGGSFCRVLVLAAPKRALSLAVADTEARREHGLMGVAAVPAGQGMLFAFPDGLDSRRGFWMKDTIAPLDMIFVTTDGTVSAIAANVPATKPHTPDDKVARRNGYGRYVIELAAGGAKAAGLHAGDHLTLPAVAAE